LFCSVTDQEVFHGILKNTLSEIENKVFVFIREIENIELKALENPKLGSRFIEINKDKIDDEVRNMRVELQSRVQKKLGDTNIKKFKVCMLHF
jgi:hypothetical protein